MALVGLSLFKHDGKRDHPRIIEAASKIEQMLGSHDPAKLDINTLEIYSTGLAIIFLVEVDPVRYRADIECLLASLRLRQKPHGGWGYSNQETGDTSMTQYGVLSSWEAKQAGIDVPMQSVENVMNWLLHTQDPSGGFGYQGVVSKDATLVAQSQVKHSLTAAGLGSIYVCSTLLDMTEKTEKHGGPLPPAVKEIKPKEGGKERAKFKSRIDPALVRAAEDRGNQWLEQNYKIDPPGYTHYFLYALERCMSFREFCEQKVEREPRWYDDGAQYLIKTQNANGSWKSDAGNVPDTAFGVLFLLRSMQKSLAKAYAYGEGTMVGGRGIPKDTSKVELRGGQVVPRSLLGPAERLLAALGNPEGKDFDSNVEVLAELPSDTLESLSAKHKEQIRRLVAISRRRRRLAAVRALGKTRDLDNADVLIYALTDPEPGVVRAANEGLLRISRSPSLVQLPDEFSDEDRRLVMEKWKAWYRAIRPKADVDF